jgi:uncharacterized protein YeaO (DUF488 family)
MRSIQIKRVYEPLHAKDGFRILTERLWPRGMKKENAAINAWLKDVAPSATLRKWFAHDPAKWADFKKKYYGELKGSKAVDELLALIKKHDRVTLVYAAKDEQHNAALALQQYFYKKIFPKKVSTGK